MSLFVTSSHISFSRGVSEPWYRPVNGFHMLPNMNEGLAVGLSTAAGSAGATVCAGTTLAITAGIASPFIVPAAIAAGLFGFGTTFYGVIKNLYARTPTGLYLRAANIRKAIENSLARDDNFAFDDAQDAAAYASATSTASMPDDQWPLLVAEKRFQKYIMQLTVAADCVAQAQRRFNEKNNDEAVDDCTNLADSIKTLVTTIQYRIGLLQSCKEYFKQHNAYLKHYSGS